MNFAVWILRQGQLILVLLVILVVVMCGAPDKKSVGLSLADILSGKTGDMQIDGHPEVYQQEGIFTYMNGAGEIYRMYGYRRLEVVRLKGLGAPEITIELFDMGSASDAYGVFSHMKESPEVGVGEGSEYRKGLLCFWQGEYFVCIKSSEENPEIRQTIFDIAGNITAAIPPANTIPVIMKLIPEEYPLAGPVRYFHLFSTLNYHYYLAEDNILNLNEQTEAFLATYDPYKSLLLCIKYPSASLAEKSYEKFVSSYIPEAGEDGIMVLEENKWVVSEAFNEYIFVVFDAPNGDYGKSLIKSAKKKLQ